MFKGQINNAAISNIDAIQAESINLYPVPSSEQLTVQLSEKFTSGHYQIVNLQGQVVLEADFAQNVFDVNVSNLMNAQYVISIKSQDVILNKPFTVNR